MLKRYVRALLIVLALLAAVPPVAFAYWSWQTDREYRPQLDFVAAHLREIAASEAPTPKWLATATGFDDRPFSPEEIFYFFKVWLVTSGIEVEDLESISVQGPGLRSQWPFLTPLFRPWKFRDGIELRIEIGSERVPLSTLIRGTGASAKIVLMFNPLSECLFEPDLDRDGDVDRDDVAAARKETGAR